MGAIAAYVIYISSILTFLSRLIGRDKLGQAFGYATLLMGFPLAYLFYKGPMLDRSALYYIQIGLMLAWILVCLFLDYLYKVEFRQNRPAVIAFVVLFFAGTGGMLGVTALAGRVWLIPAVVLFLIMAVLAFVQRAVTGK
jgi:hypothetical protein